MKASKFIILAAGILGLLAFFLPLVAVKDSGVKGALSAFQIVKGLDGAQDQVSANAKELDVQLAAMNTTVNGRAATSKDANEALGAVKGVVMAIFAPALLLAIIGGIAASRKKLGRLGGFGALFFGLIGLAIWASSTRPPTRSRPAPVAATSRASACGC